MHEPLKNCPFCGEAAKHSFNSLYGDMSMASCKSCGATAYAPKWNRRAVLAKWGQPAQAAEPVARLVIGKTKGGVSLTHMVVPAAYQLQEGMYALYTAPLPVAREPLSDEEVDSLCKVGPVYAPDGKVTLTPPQYKYELESAQRYGLRKGERAHGIKKRDPHVE